MINLLGDDEWRPVKRWRMVIPGYYVNKKGEVISTKGKQPKFLKPTVNKCKRKGNWENKILESLQYTLMVPKDFFPDYTPKPRRDLKNARTVCIRASVHKTVMEVWKPIEDNPPIPVEDWNECPETAKQFIIDCAIIDHLDDDPANNHVDNLRWCTPKENSSWRKKFNSGLD